MSRPFHNKNKSNGFWGNPQDQSEETNSKQIYTRKKVKIIKPDLTTNDFGRILPRKMYKDRQRLYSEGLQLKQAINEIADQNIRLKTQVSVLQKQQHRASRMTESHEKSRHQYPEHSKGKYFESKTTMNNYKRLLRQYKEQNAALLSENKKIRKTLKYIKINQLEIQLKVIIEENEKLASLVEQYGQRANRGEQLEQQNQDLQVVIEKQHQSNKRVMEQNRDMALEIEQIEESYKREVQKWRLKENKLVRELNSQKKKTFEQMRHNQNLRREISLMLETKHFDSKKKTVKSAHRQFTSINQNPGNFSRLSQGRQGSAKGQQESASFKFTHETKSLMQQISLLKEELQTVRKELNRQKQIKREGSSPRTIEEYSDSKLEHPQMKPQMGKQQSDINVEAVYYEQFQATEEAPLSQNEPSKRQEERLKKIKEDFEDKQSEEELFKKDEKKKEKKPASQKKKTRQKNAGYKMNKKALADIKQLLTYRMKSQRYPLSDLQNDIQNSEVSAFNHTDLTQMLLNEPFYLNKQYAQILLTFCYQKDEIDKKDKLDNTILIAKLRRVIDSFTLMSEDKEKEMIIRIAQMVSSYPQELQIAFENIKNGDETVSKKDMIQMFKKLSLEDDYIDLIISQLSLCSEDLDHLNFHGFFERFYIAEQQMVQEPIEEEEGQDESRQNSSRVKKDSKKHKDSKKSL